MPSSSPSGLSSVWPDELHLLGPGDVGLAALPLYHAFGQSNIQNGVLFGGGTVSYLLRFCPAAAAQACARDRVTFFAGVPTMYIGLLNDPDVTDDQLATLTRCVSGGAALPVEVKEEFFQRFGLRIQEGYGLTETSPLACIQPPNETAKAGTIGKPVLGVDMKIFDDQDREVPQGERGEIVIRGHNIMKGYFKRPEATAEAMRNGWFHSGDIGYVDPQGDFFIVDRKKDLIIRGGYNVYPREVEEALYSHPAVAEAAVIGVPDATARRRGEGRRRLASGNDGHSGRHCPALQRAGRRLQISADREDRRFAAKRPNRKDPQAGPPRFVVSAGRPDILLRDYSLGTGMLEKSALSGRQAANRPWTGRAHFT